MTDRRPIGYWLKLVDRLIDELFASTLEEHGVTRRQWQLLGVLSRGPATEAQLTDAVSPFLRPSGGAGEDGGEAAAAESVVDHLGELVESGWVAQAESGYAITARGEVAHARLAEVVAANRDAATEGIDAGEYATTLATLERVARNLGWSDEPDDEPRVEPTDSEAGLGR